MRFVSQIISRLFNPSQKQPFWLLEKSRFTQSSGIGFFFFLFVFYTTKCNRSRCPPVIGYKTNKDPFSAYDTVTWFFPPKTLSLSLSLSLHCGLVKKKKVHLLRRLPTPDRAGTGARGAIVAVHGTLSRGGGGASLGLRGNLFTRLLIEFFSILVFNKFLDFWRWKNIVCEPAYACR